MTQRFQKIWQIALDQAAAQEPLALSNAANAIEIDHMPMDILVLDAEGVLKRPFITFVVDPITRCILQLEITFNRVSCDKAGGMSQ